jgi:hypothetical protein
MKSTAPEAAARGDELFQFDEPEAAGPAPALPAGGTGEGPAPPDMTPEGPATPEGGLRPMGLVDDTALAPEPHAAEPEPRSGGTSALPPVVVPLLLVMASANLILVGLTWQSLRRPPAAAPLSHASATAAPGGAEHGAAAAAADGHGGALPGELPRRLGSRDNAHAILADAERTLAAGEFVEARRALYALLAVLDRLELGERADVEARAGYLIAETYRRQAQSLGPAGGEPGPAPAPKTSADRPGSGEERAH